MKPIAILLCCLLAAGGPRHASAAGELDAWRERAGQTAAGQPLAEAERLFPVYTPSCFDPAPPMDHLPMTFAFGAHRLRLRWVARDLAVWIDYTTDGHLLTGPATVERRNPPAMTLGFPRPALRDAAFTLPNTVGESVNSFSTRLR